MRANTGRGGTAGHGLNGAQPPNGRTPLERLVAVEEQIRFQHRDQERLWHRIEAVDARWQAADAARKTEFDQRGARILSTVIGLLLAFGGAIGTIVLSALELV